MRPGPQHRRPRLGPLLFAGALACYAAAVPLGPDATRSGEATSALGLHKDGAPPAAPLALLAMRALTYLPVGDAATRLNFASAVAGAIAVALLGLLARQVVAMAGSPGGADAPSDGRSEGAERPGWSSGSDAASASLAAAGGAATVGLALGVFSASTRAGTIAATLAVTAGGLLLAMRVLRCPGDGRAGGCFALVAGLAAGLGPAASLGLWPAGVALWLWALRRGERWPLVAPVLFAAGLGAALAPVAMAPASHPAADLAAAAALAVIERPNWAWAELQEPADQIGVVGLMLGSIGTLVLCLRAPFACAFVIWALAAVAWASGPQVLPAMAAIPIAAGMAHLGARLGRAAVPAVLALAVIAAASPALDGGHTRWTADGRAALRWIDRALAAAPVRGVVEPAPRREALLGYARALGLRPDLVHAAARTPPAPRR